MRPIKVTTLPLYRTLMEAIKRVFWRNNYATSIVTLMLSPKVLVKAAYQLEYLTKNEFVYLMYNA